MGSKLLEDLMRTVVEHYGVAQVTETVRKLERAEKRLVHVPKKEDPPPRSAKPSLRPRSAASRPKMTALRYVEALNPKPESKENLMQLAEMFEEKTFLATLRDIREFCASRNIDVPISTSRVASIPRIFRALSTMPAEEIRDILESGRYSGPYKLAPIADAIRRRSENLKPGSTLSSGKMPGSQVNSGKASIGRQ